MKPNAAVSFVVCMLLAASFPVEAGETQKTVRFAKGKSSATMTDSIKGDTSIAYMLNARAGQVMSVLFSPGNTSCYMNVSEPGADSAVHIGSSAGNEYAANLAASGDYRIQVYLMRNAARRNETCKFSITFEVTGGSM
jgi:hypothetical protein